MKLFFIFVVSVVTGLVSVLLCQSFRHYLVIDQVRYESLFSQAPSDDRIFLVTADRQTWKKYPNFTKSNRLISDALKKLLAGTPAVIGLDIALDEKLDGSKELISTIGSRRNIITAKSLDAANNIVPWFQDLEDSGGSYGTVSILKDRLDTRA